MILRSGKLANNEQIPKRKYNRMTVNPPSNNAEQTPPAIGGSMSVVTTTEAISYSQGTMDIPSMIILMKIISTTVSVTIPSNA